MHLQNDAESHGDRVGIQRQVQFTVEAAPSESFHSICDIYRDNGLPDTLTTCLLVSLQQRQHNLSQVRVRNDQFELRQFIGGKLRLGQEHVPKGRLRLRGYYMTFGGDQANKQPLRLEELSDLHRI
jgi:hypothetical protein